MKIGIASCYYNKNYGSMLQAYATQKIVEKLGYEAITIQCDFPINYMTQSKVSYCIHKLTSTDIIRTKTRQIKAKIYSSDDSDYKRGKEERNKYFEDFYRHNVKLTESNKTRCDLTNRVASMRAVIVGSDMLWHPVNIEHDYYTLTFVPDNVRKISYATSFGTTKIPGYQKRITRDFLDRFYALSVREVSGVKVIHELGVNKIAQVVLDPTLLFTSDEWMQIQDEKPFVDGEYIFCYYLGINQEHRRIANEIKAKTGCKIVFLPHLDEYIEGDRDFGDEQLYNVGPVEFINLIRNAKYVLTDSFHGSCFSILNHQHFIIFSRFDDSNTQSTNTRIDSLLGIVGLENHHITKFDNIDKIYDVLESDIDYKIVDEKLAEVRRESIFFLKKALD